MREDAPDGPTGGHLPECREHGSPNVGYVIDWDEDTYFPRIRECLGGEPLDTVMRQWVNHHLQMALDHLRAVEGGIYG